MGKIQKALEKVQADRGRNPTGPVRPSPKETDSVVVAQLAAGMESDPMGHRNSRGDRSKCLNISRESLREEGLIAPEADEELLAKQYQDIKRPLIAHAFGKRATKTNDGNIIMITSSTAGEGKTFTSINLALSMTQEKDHSVLLVDADVARPRTSELFGAADQPGLLDLLEEPDLRLESTVLRTNIPGLHILPAGRPRINATELLASSRMESIIAGLASFRTGGIVLLDSPPLLQTSEAKVLSTVAGQIALVVKAEHTSRDAVMTAISMLAQDKPVNLILNQAHTRNQENSYSYAAPHSYVEEKMVSAAESGKDMWGNK